MELKKKHNSLNEFANWLEKNKPDEKIIERKGYELVTSKHIYRMYESNVRIYDKD